MRHPKPIDPEILKEVNSILGKPIDPVFLEIAKKIVPEIVNPRYMPWLLASKMDIDSAKIINALPDMKWRPEFGEFGVSPEFAHSLGLDSERISAQLQERFFSGDVMTDIKKGPVLTISRGLWIDMQHNEEWLVRNGPAYFKIIGIMLEQEYTPLMERDAEERIRHGVMGAGRIIPRYDSVKDILDLLPAENYKTILQSRELLVQSTCACRIRYPEYNQDASVCFGANGIAKLQLKMRLGKQIRWEEAFELVQKSGKKNPMVHINKHGMQLSEIGGVLCNCNSETCGVMRNTTTTGGEHKIWDYYAKSRFRAYLAEPGKCVDCGLCQNRRCMFDAIQTRYSRELGIEKRFVNESICMGCGCCVETCPTGALKMKLVDPPEVLRGRKSGSSVPVTRSQFSDLADSGFVQGSESKAKGSFPYDM